MQSKYKKLKAYNQDADCTLTTSEDITISYIDDDGKYTKKNTPIVFIEPMDKCPECVHEYMHEDYDVRWCSFYDKECKKVEECYQFEEFVDPF